MRNVEGKRRNECSERVKKTQWDFLNFSIICHYGAADNIQLNAIY